ncbi:MAG: DUF3276 family protein [Lentimicrobiaceae bacterium]|nr:DUF3276 family protein [Lentimicrobiaceae bacterium]
MNDEEIYSEKLTKGSHTYFFDAKKNKYGDLYLKISERKGSDYHRLMVFDEDVDDFVEAFERLMNEFQEIRKATPNRRFVK